jgi:hypothetical protein
MLDDQVSNAATELLSQFRGMACSDNIRLRILREVPWRVQNTGVSRFGRARRHKDCQPIDFAAGYLFKLIQEQAMMRSRLKSRAAAPLS